MPSNPNNLKSAYESEAAYAGSDLNQNGTKADSLGGHLINHASVTLRYVSESNAVLQTELTLVGNNLTTYLSADGLDIPQPVDVYNPTAAEQQAIDTALTNYYHIGQTMSFTPPEIAGYTTPSPATQSFVLGAATTTHTFVYVGPPAAGGTTNSSTGGELANTGVQIMLITVAALSLIGLGSWTVRRKTSRTYRVLGR